MKIGRRLFGTAMAWAALAGGAQRRRAKPAPSPRPASAGAGPITDAHAVWIPIRTGDVVRYVPMW